MACTAGSPRSRPGLRRSGPGIIASACPVGPRALRMPRIASSPIPTHQFLLRTGKTSFLDMQFEQLSRMALDIEVTTAPGFEFPNAARESDRIIAIALADSARALHRALRRRDVRGRSPRRMLPDHPRAGPGCARGPQHLPLRSRVPGGARPTPPDPAPMGPGRLDVARSRVADADRGSHASAIAATPWRDATSWTPGSWPSSTTWPHGISRPTASRTWRGTSAWPLRRGPTCRPRTSRASSARIPDDCWPMLATT